MKRSLHKISIILVVIFLTGLKNISFAQEIDGQEIIEIDPLFDYPVAPEDIISLTDKSNYLVTHFWDPLDFKNKQAVDQNALNEAFRVYTTPMRLAELQIVNQSVDKLIDKISGNPTLLIQFTKAAEENLYGPRAEIWIDDIYLKFVDAALKNKKISELRKEKLKKRSTILHNSLIGNPPPTFSFENIKGDQSHYFPMSTPTILIFGDPENMDWRMARLRMETNSALSQALDKGKINILYIIPFDLDNWQNSVSSYSSKWVVGKNENLMDVIDIRFLPAIYVVGSDGKLLLKNVQLENAINTALGLIDKPS